jgi:hypothetical protein
VSNHSMKHRAGRRAWPCLCLVLLTVHIAAAQTQAPARTQQGPQERERTVWIAVLDWELRLKPVIVLTNGRWWTDLAAVESPEDNDPKPVRERLVQGQPLNAQSDPWTLLDPRLPITWHAHMLNGSEPTVRVSGPPDTSDVENSLSFPTDLPASALKIGPDELTKGIAIAGDTHGIDPFVEVAPKQRQQLLRFLQAPLQRVEWDAVKRAAATSDQDTSIWAGLTRKDMLAHAFKVDYLLQATLRDGTTTYYLQGLRSGYDKGEFCGLLTNAIASRSPSGALRVERVTATTYRDDYVGIQPLAIVERPGGRCWVTQLQYEDGLEYDVVSPDRVFTDSPTASCGLRE